MANKYLQLTFLGSYVKPITASNKEIVVVGRSNAGKSTFINSIGNNGKLARVSSTPGKTLTLNYYHINSAKPDLYLVDTPGYGYHAKGLEITKELNRMMDYYLIDNRKLRACFWIFDIRRDFVEDDILLLDFLKKINIPVYVLLSKSDKLSNQQIIKRKTSIRAQIDVPEENIIPFSSMSNLNIVKIATKAYEILLK
ncbi:hypothetical protein ASO20_02790 [Mycoplasma sp. (ex Biomphalaria glabrata)]|uniref:ribosome biogenesis GTP-binding protein YihA/YsxC n=1 Tax=Mycoplasma sp. (ex Biomphalaria glabrata) TaxID=1749074 RepID=UPI00073A618B|nr:ribosome biogenesis GTP-binding protein YihA/YsxC [Mycoplasma sp. (ex Biomphalaria glabrata)]ALV23560.1 hypothetical protein ASO20_02790 [Mycoplasma sp. (ex Biomphalaria glabrata)]